MDSFMSVMTYSRGETGHSANAVQGLDRGIEAKALCARCITPFSFLTGAQPLSLWPDNSPASVADRAGNRRSTREEILDGTRLHG